MGGLCRPGDSGYRLCWPFGQRGRGIRRRLRDALHGLCGGFCGGLAWVTVTIPGALYMLVIRLPRLFSGGLRLDCIMQQDGAPFQVSYYGPLRWGAVRVVRYYNGPGMYCFDQGFQVVHFQTKIDILHGGRDLPFSY